MMKKVLSVHVHGGNTVQYETLFFNSSLVTLLWRKHLCGTKPYEGRVSFQTNSSLSYSGKAAFSINPFSMSPITL